MPTKLKGQFHKIWGFFNGYIGRASFPDPPLVFLKFLCCVVIEILNSKDPMQLMQKTLPSSCANTVGYGYSILSDH
jgi:hypothetical protein